MSVFLILYPNCKNGYFENCIEFIKKFNITNSIRSVCLYQCKEPPSMHMRGNLSMKHILSKLALIVSIIKPKSRR